MTAGAGDRQALGRLGQHVDLVVDLVSPRLDRVGRGIEDLPQPVHAGSDRVDVVRAVRRQPRRHEVAGDLLLQEAVVGQVGVERLDDVVAEPPSIELVVVEFVTVGLGPAHQVQPVSPPALPVMRRAEQPFDDARVRPRSPVGQKLLQLGWGRRQAGQIERDPSQQRPPVGSVRRFQSLGLQPGEDEPIHVSARPVRVAYLRPRRPAYRAKTPELPTLL